MWPGGASGRSGAIRPWERFEQELGAWNRDGSRTPLIFGTVPAWQASRLNLSRVLGVCGLATFALLEQVRPKEKAAGCEAGPKLPGTLAFWPPKVYE